MHKIMALDVGTKRIGIALSDYLQVIATPHSTIQRVPENNAIYDTKSTPTIHIIIEAYLTKSIFLRFIFAPRCIFYYRYYIQINIQIFKGD